MEATWVHSSPYSPLPTFAVVGGHDVDGSPIYVGRSFHEGDTLPAKVIPSKRTAFVSWNGGEHMKSHYEVLVGQNYSWAPCAGGSVPPNAVRAGNTSSGEPLYVGRGHYMNSLCVGKIHPSHGCLYIPFGGQEIRVNSYEVLLMRHHDNWVAAAPSYTPPGAVVAGYDSDRATIYVGRAMHEGYKWIHSSVYATMPPNAVAGGNDSDGAVIYVGRSFHNGDTLVAKIIPSKHCAYISWRGQEIAKTHFEVLCSEKVAWQHCYDHVIPHNAVLCGNTALGQPVYIGRGHFEGSLTVGKVSSVHRALFIAYGGIERRLNNYEILVVDVQDVKYPDLPMDVKPPIPQLPPLPPAFSYDPPPPYAPPATHLPVPPTMPPYHYTPATHYETSTPALAQQYDTWVTASIHYTPPNAVHAGHDADLSPIIVCRAFHNGELLPGKAIPSKGSAYVSYNGEEIPKTNYEVLVGHNYHWVAAQDGNIAFAAVQGGHTSSGEPLFVGRAHYCGTLTPGKIHRGHQCLYLPFAGRERRVNRYEVLVRRDEYFRQHHALLD